MRLQIISFSKRGALLCEELCEELPKRGYTCTGYGMERYTKDFSILPCKGSLSEWTKAAFAAADGIVFIGACGIAVRAIAPLLCDKLSDPAVVSVDDMGQFSIALCSGHVGGANALAKDIAAITRGQSVVSTATDLHGHFSVDLWARENGLYIANKNVAKRISSRLLDGGTVSFCSDFPLSGKLPKGIVKENSGELGFCVSFFERARPFDSTLVLVPKIVSLGLGCRRGVPPELLENAVAALLSQEKISINALSCVASIDIKRDEPAILEFCRRHSLGVLLYSAEELAKAKGDFSSSEFVEGITGVDNVCERAAALSCGGELIVKKQNINSVTVALARPNWEVCFR